MTTRCKWATCSSLPRPRLASHRPQASAPASWAWWSSPKTRRLCCWWWTRPPPPRCGLRDEGCALGPGVARPVWTERNSFEQPRRSHLQRAPTPRAPAQKQPQQVPLRKATITARQVLFRVPGGPYTEEHLRAFAAVAAQAAKEAADQQALAVSSAAAATATGPEEPVAAASAQAAPSPLEAAWELAGALSPACPDTRSEPAGPHRNDTAHCRAAPLTLARRPARAHAWLQWRTASRR